jgi:DNA-binding LacI/PurR family transcriptional regulator
VAHDGVRAEANMADVAAHAGVSIATVSRALRGLPGVGSATRERVRAVADELAYVVSPEASGLAGRAKGRIAVVVPRIDVWFYGTVLATIEREVREAGFDVLVYQVDGEDQRRRFFTDLPARRKVDALVLIALPLLAAEVDRLQLLGVHVVVAGGRILDFPRVEVDDAEITRTAMEHLLDLGHRRIAMIRTDDTYGASWSADGVRTATWREALASRGLIPTPGYLVSEPYGVEAGARATERLLLLDPRPTAIFAFSDEIAVSAWRALQEHGLRVPHDMSLVGVDGHPLGELFAITTVAQDVQRQALEAARMATELVRGEALTHRVVTVGSHLVERGSTAPPPEPAARSAAQNTAQNTAWS